MAVIYNVVRGDGVFFEGLTKEQIYELLAEMTGETTQDVDQAFITKLKEINKGNNIRLWLGTTAEYNAIETKEEDVLYICTDDTFVQDTGEEIEQLWKKINANYNTVQEALTEQNQAFNEFKEEITGEFEGISGSSLHIVDKGSYKFPATGSNNTPAHALPQVNVGEVGKLTWETDDSQGSSNFNVNRTFGGFSLPSGVYFVLTYASEKRRWDGGSDGSHIITYNVVENISGYSGQVILKSDTGNATFYRGNGYVFYMRFA